jgi:hypothetical protein
LLEVLEVLGVFVVDDLLEQLDGGLGAVVVCEGHVKVVNEVDDLAERVLRPVLDRVFFVHLAHDEVEELSGEDVVVESGRDRADFVVLLALLGDPVQELVDEGGFAGADATYHADRAVRELVQLHDAALLVDVEVGHDDLEEHLIAHVFPRLRHVVFPVDPVPVGRAVLLVEQQFFPRHALALLAHLLVEELDVLVLAHDAAKRPGCGLLEEHRDRDLAFVFVGVAQLHETLALFVVEEIGVEDGRDALADRHASDRHCGFDLRQLHVHHGFPEPARIVAELDLGLDGL